MNDSSIVELFWDRNETAIRELSDKYTPYCFKIAWNILFNREDAEECLNDTWLSAWSCIPPKRPAVLSTFVGRITRGFAIDRYRKRYAGKRPDTHMAHITGEAEQLNFSYTLDEHMEKEQFIHILNQFLRKLTETERDIFVRRYWYMDSVKDIAKRHGISVSCVKSRLYRNRKRLFKLLEEERCSQ